MPKLKTKSSAKKRFKFTAGGKVMSTQSTKRHGMTKRSKRSIRTHRGMSVVSSANALAIASFMPYSR